MKVKIYTRWDTSRWKLKEDETDESMFKSEYKTDVEKKAGIRIEIDNVKSVDEALNNHTDGGMDEYTSGGCGPVLITTMDDKVIYDAYSAKTADEVNQMANERFEEYKEASKRVRA